MRTYVDALHRTSSNLDQVPLAYSVYDGPELIGFIIARSGETFEAWDLAQRGTFTTLDEAMCAIGPAP
jgi:hypothetical protein